MVVERDWYHQKNKDWHQIGGKRDQTKIEWIGMVGHSHLSRETLERFHPLHLLFVVLGKKMGFVELFAIFFQYLGVQLATIVYIHQYFEWSGKLSILLLQEKHHLSSNVGLLCEGCNHLIST